MVSRNPTNRGPWLLWKRRQQWISCNQGEVSVPLSTGQQCTRKLCGLVFTVGLHNQREKLSVNTPPGAVFCGTGCGGNMLPRVCQPWRGIRSHTGFKGGLDRMKSRMISWALFFNRGGISPFTWKETENRRFMWRQDCLYKLLGTHVHVPHVMTGLSIQASGYTSPHMSCDDSLTVYKFLGTHIQTCPHMSCDDRIVCTSFWAQHPYTSLQTYHSGIWLHQGQISNE